MKINILLLACLLLVASCQNQGGRRMFDEAMVMWQEGRHEEAVQNFIALTKAYPEDPLVDDAVFWIANIYEHYLKNTTQAIRYYRSLTKGFENSEYYYPSMLGLARCYAVEGKESKEGIRKAILIYQKLTESKLDAEDEAQIYYNLAQLYFETKQYEQTRLSLKKLITRSPKSPLAPRAYHLIGFSYYLEGKLDLAEATYVETERSFEQSKASLDSAISLADIYEDQDRLAEAIEVYNSIIVRLKSDEIFFQLANSRIAKLKTRLKQTNKG